MGDGCFVKALGIIGTILGILASIILIYQFTTGHMTLPIILGPQPTATSSVTTPGTTVTQTPSSTVSQTPSPSTIQTSSFFASRVPNFIVTASSNIWAWAIWIAIGFVVSFIASIITEFDGWLLLGPM